jgi:hypothetical protein
MDELRALWRQKIKVPRWNFDPAKTLRPRGDQERVVELATAGRGVPAIPCAVSVEIGAPSAIPGVPGRRFRELAFSRSRFFSAAVLVAVYETKRGCGKVLVFTITKRAIRSGKGVCPGFGAA